MPGIRRRARSGESPRGGLCLECRGIRPVAPARPCPAFGAAYRTQRLGAADLAPRALTEACQVGCREGPGRGDSRPWEVRACAFVSRGPRDNGRRRPRPDPLAASRPPASGMTETGLTTRPQLNSARARALRERAHDLIPGGSHTYNKGDDQWPESTPTALVRGSGCRVW